MAMHIMFIYVYVVKCRFCQMLRYAGAAHEFQHSSWIEPQEDANIEAGATSFHLTNDNGNTYDRESSEMRLPSPSRCFTICEHLERKRKEVVIPRLTFSSHNRNCHNLCIYAYDKGCRCCSRAPFSRSFKDESMNSAMHRWASIPTCLP